MTIAAGAPIDVDDVSDAVARCGVKLRRVAGLSVNSATQTDITWDTEDEDTNGFWSSGTTITIPSGFDGVYAITYSPTVSSLTTGTRNFGDIIVVSSVAGGYPAFYRNLFDIQEDRTTIAATIALIAGDTIKCDVFHSQGAARDVTAHFSCYRVGL